MEVEDANEESDAEENDSNDIKLEQEDELPAVPCSKGIIHDVEWIGDSVAHHKQRTYYTAAKVGEGLPCHFQ